MKAKIYETLSEMFQLLQRESENKMEQKLARRMDIYFQQKLFNMKLSEFGFSKQK